MGGIFPPPTKKNWKPYLLQTIFRIVTKEILILISLIVTPEVGAKEMFIKKWRTFHPQGARGEGGLCSFKMSEILEYF